MSEDRINQVYLDEIAHSITTDPEESRKKVKKSIEQRLFFAYEIEQRKDYIEAYRRLFEGPFDELLLIKDSLEINKKPKIHPASESIRDRVWNSNIFEQFVMIDESGAAVIYRIEWRFQYRKHGKKYVLLTNLKEEEGKENPQCYIWEFVEAENPEDEKIIKVSDPELVKELEAYAEKIMMGLDDDDDW